MNIFDEEYKRLNKAQRQAVDSTEGPQLVIAGPGTGKTQLLSMRVANILKNNDVGPGNILCLTFTDNAARNMRERLIAIIGQPAYHVAIHTFHSFGSDTINQYPDYFTDRQLIQQVDELGRYELLHDIFETLPHSNSLSVKVGDTFVFLKNTLDVIGWLKQNAISPEELSKLLEANQRFIDSISKDLAETFSASPSPKDLAQYEQLLSKAQKYCGPGSFGFPNFATLFTFELAQAIEQTDANAKYAKTVTAWRNNWCKKNAEGNYVLKDGDQAYRKMQAVTEVYRQLSESMAAQGLYDFDDMVTLAAHAMENDDELRYNLQERYQYVLVDEFQDTNKAQLRMLTALGNNPVYEGQPNLMAVGDDDQAIYAFQGAETSNMAAFAHQYKLKPIVLTDNYRSSENILTISSALADQIDDRLQLTASKTQKQLVAQQTYPKSSVDYLQFPSELAQYDWIADEIEKTIKAGAKPDSIAVIAPRHRYLERLMPYLGTRQLPVAYERRENVLDAPLIIELTTMSRLITAIKDNRQDDVDALISEVLGFDFWGISTETLTELSLSAYNQNKHWLELLTNHQDKQLKAIATWFSRLAKRSHLEPMEYMLDKLIDGDALGVDSEYDELQLAKTKPDKFISPFKSYYFNAKRYESATDSYLTLLGQLSTLRQRLRQWKPHQALYIKDLVSFVDLHTQANLKIVDNNPHTQSTNAIQVMTAYKAKGLEFNTVFVINTQDEIWGPTARSQSSRISLPRNLPIAPAGDSDNDRRRLLFVAMTRAKHTLHLTGYSHSLENKPSPSLSFIADIAQLKPRLISKSETIRSVEILATNWAYRFRQVIADKPSLFEPIIETYKLSVTHLNNYIDVMNAGPEYFLVHNLLRFPEAPSPSAAYGDAVHRTLQWVQNELRKKGQIPPQKAYQDYFSDMLSRKHLLKTENRKLDQRGRSALSDYFKQRSSSFDAKDIVERGFHNEGVVVAGARLSGKIDKLSFSESGSVEVIDFKTGKPASSWQGKDEFEKVKLHKYRQQLLFYKLLVEGSASYARKLAVRNGALEFIEPNEQGKLVNNLELSFDDQELSRFTKLIGAVWQHIMTLSFPDTSKYPKSLKGLQQFEADLIENKI